MEPPEGEPTEQPERTGGQRARFLFRHRNLLGSAIAAFLIFFPFWRMPPSAPEAACGVLLVLGGTLLRLWSILQIGGRARKVVSMKAIHVITWGPYSLCRNPLYTANVAVLGGFSVLSGHLWALPLVVGSLWLWYDQVIRLEEEFLASAFPDAFREYRLSTNRWLPRLKFRGRPPGVPPYPIARMLKRERAHLLAVLGGAVLVALFLAFPGFEPMRALFRLLPTPVPME